MTQLAPVLNSSPTHTAIRLRSAYVWGGGSKMSLLAVFAARVFHGRRNRLTNWVKLKWAANCQAKSEHKLDRPRWYVCLNESIGLIKRTDRMANPPKSPESMVVFYNSSHPHRKHKNFAHRFWSLILSSNKGSHIRVTKEQLWPNTWQYRGNVLRNILVF